MIPQACNCSITETITNPCNNKYQAMKSTGDAKEEMDSYWR
jgi:hypothetical protein